MERRKIGIINIILIIALIAIPILSGCSNEEFTYVSSIKYTTEGRTVTRSSHWYKNWYCVATITKEEYDSSPQEDRIDSSEFSSGTIIAKKQLPPKNQMGTCSYTQKPENYDGRVKYCATWDSIEKRYRYGKYTYKGVVFVYIQVKIIDSTTIAIKDNMGITVYSVSSYQIKDLF